MPVRRVQEFTMFASDHQAPPRVVPGFPPEFHLQTWQLNSLLRIRFLFGFPLGLSNPSTLDTDQIEPKPRVTRLLVRSSRFCEVHQYGDAALVFASHDGYPQIVNGLLYNRELGGPIARNLAREDFAGGNGRACQHQWYHFGAGSLGERDLDPWPNGKYRTSQIDRRAGGSQFEDLTAPR